MKRKGVVIVLLAFLLVGCSRNNEELFSDISDSDEVEMVENEYVDMIVNVKKVQYQDVTSIEIINNISNMGYIDIDNDNINISSSNIEMRNENVEEEILQSSNRYELEENFDLNTNDVVELSYTEDESQIGVEVEQEEPYIDMEEDDYIDDIYYTGEKIQDYEAEMIVDTIIDDGEFIHVELKQKE